MEYRAENKYLVNDKQLSILAARLKCVLNKDIHQTGNCYSIRSLYFDDYWNRCMLENEAGVNERKKFRIRTYNSNADNLKLEIKEKKDGFTKKTSCSISKDEYEKIIGNNLSLNMDDRVPLNLLKLNMKTAMMRPKVIIEYERTAFVYSAGNVRITFDRNISVSRYTHDFLKNKVSCKMPVLPPGMHILEVKYDEFLPDFIAELIEDGTRNQTAFSKYYMGRLALEGDLSERMIVL